MKKTRTGSCHCGAVRFECDLDLDAGTRKCNCSYCTKTRLWKAFALDGEFRLVSGEEMLSDYQASPSNWPKGNVHHYFCRHCGVRGFSKGYLEMEPFNGWFHAINLATLDNVTDEELVAAPVIFEDGRNDAWDRPPAETRQL
ncbi:MAG TPA: GFA family protein [Gammaproteobacteria bacterium]